jgi:RNA polymerase sigma factor (TIGR02999 family)
MNDVTQILARIEKGNPTAAKQLLPLVYDELRKLAVLRMKHENPGQTLQATALVHEAYLRLVDVEHAQSWENRGHFFAAAAEAMRRILVENARRKNRVKRGGDLMRTELDNVPLVAPEIHEDLIALDAAIDRLKAVDPQAVELERDGRTVLRISLEENTSDTPAEVKPIESLAKAPPLAKAPFDEQQAKQHQQDWADYLGVPVEKELSLGQDKNGKDIALTMVLIPPGEFMIGATDQEQVKWLSEAKAEHPNAKADAFVSIHMEDQHFVRLTKPFWLGKFEFKTGQFRRFVESTGYSTDAETNGKGAAKPAADKVFERLPELHWDNWGKISVDAGPVVNVSWNDAAKCCEWLSSQHPDMAFSLPTEAQWEFACRAGTRSSLYDCHTSEELRQYAQFGREVHFIQRGGQLRPNNFGFYDMLGNVTEWCSNWLARYEKSQTDDPVGPAVPGNYAWRAVRGGSFIHDIWQVRSSKRDFYAPDNCFFDRGFRVAAAITDASVLPIAKAASGAQQLPHMVAD